jgi:hypothetical protein
MTKERAVRAWTDYPIIGLGDRPGKIAPIRLVDVLSYDRDKHYRVRVGNVVELVKRCTNASPAQRGGRLIHKINGPRSGSQHVRSGPRAARSSS